MKEYQQQFIDAAIANGVLSFGEFTLKSGRSSPYFFNAGRFDNGMALDLLGRSYAAALIDAGIEFDMLFGPAYKGIPLASVTSMALARDYTVNTPVCFNRKEAKDHGEGGTLIGAPLAGKVVIVDDVITAGTAVREVLATIANSPAHAAAILIGLDRQERGSGQLSAIQEIEQTFGIPVVSIIKLDDVLVYLQQHRDHHTLEKVAQYRRDYGV